jgi:hypothetical protein
MQPETVDVNLPCARSEFFPMLHQYMLENFHSELVAAALQWSLRQTLLSVDIVLRIDSLTLLDWNRA